MLIVSEEEWEKLENNGEIHNIYYKDREGNILNYNYIWINNLITKEIMIGNIE